MTKYHLICIWKDTNIHTYTLNIGIDQMDNHILCPMHIQNSIYSFHYHHHNLQFNRENKYLMLITTVMNDFWRMRIDDDEDDAIQQQSYLA